VKKKKKKRRRMRRRKMKRRPQVSSDFLTFRPQSFSEGQEKYVWELSVTPVGYFTGAISHSRGVLHGSYQSLPWGTSRELSVTPVGYFMGAVENRSRGVSHGDYFAW
jgi:hypothetical protein